MKIEKLIERVKAGDADALRTVYETYSQRMRNVCIRITQEDEDTVSDLVQESFIRAYYSLEKLKDSLEAYGQPLLLARSKPTLTSSC